MATGQEEQKTIVLVAFYNRKALGVRYLETALSQAGYRVSTIFYKDFNSVHPSPTTETELALLAAEIRKRAPLLVGLSVMSSMYLDTVYAVMDKLKAELDVPIVCGGAFATMFPERLLRRGAHYVLRCDGEIPLCRLADALRDGGELDKVPSLSYLHDGELVQNELGGILEDIDGYGIPAVACRDACYIEHDRVTAGDPQLDTRSYEVIASRGCPFTCSYCCCVNLRRLLPKGVRGVRTRSVESVIQELKLAKQSCKKIAFVHFYDEIFPNTPGWVDEFVAAYQKHIGLPFTIWSHPKAVNGELLKKLKRVGLTEVIMGIQSGSEHIRRDVFHRGESQEDILKAVRAIREAGVFWSSFDFMLQHPFESIEDLKQSYYLVKQFPTPYELQLHGLNFLPGTDIVPMAIEQGYFTEAELENIMFAPMEEQFAAYWQRERSPESRMWFQMLYCLQFPQYAKRVAAWEEDPAAHEQELAACYAQAQRRAKLRYYYKKGSIVAKRFGMRLRGLVRAH